MLILVCVFLGWRRKWKRRRRRSTRVVDASPLLPRVQVRDWFTHVFISLPTCSDFLPRVQFSFLQHVVAFCVSFTLIAGRENSTIWSTNTWRICTLSAVITITPIGASSRRRSTYGLCKINPEGLLKWRSMCGLKKLVLTLHNKLWRSTEGKWVEESLKVKRG